MGKKNEGIGGVNSVEQEEGLAVLFLGLDVFRELFSLIRSVKPRGSKSKQQDLTYLCLCCVGNEDGNKDGTYRSDRQVNNEHPASQWDVFCLTRKNSAAAHPSKSCLQLLLTGVNTKKGKERERKGRDLGQVGGIAAGARALLQIAVRLLEREKLVYLVLQELRNHWGG